MAVAAGVCSRCGHAREVHTPRRAAGVSTNGECNRCDCSQFTTLPVTDRDAEIDERVDTALAAARVVADARHEILKAERDSLRAALNGVKAHAYDLLIREGHLHDLLQEVAESSGSADDDPRLRYVTVQIDRATWAQIREAVS